MSSRILRKATAVGTLLLGAAALGGCASSASTGAAAGATQSVPVVTSTATAPTGGTNSTPTATAGSGSGDGTSTQAAGGGTASCTGSQLSLKINQGSSGMGHTGSVLVFTNTGSTACTLYGYPGADVTENGSYNFSPRMNATRVSGTAVKTVTLTPGSSASAMLEWGVNPTGGGTANAANCPGMGGGYLEVTPPNTTDTIKSDPPLNMCTDLQVFPVVAGTAGQ